MLFPHHSEEELRRLLAETNYDFEEAITVILGKDTLANAPAAGDAGGQGTGAVDGIIGQWREREGGREAPLLCMMIFGLCSQ